MTVLLLFPSLHLQTGDIFKLALTELDRLISKLFRMYNALEGANVNYILKIGNVIFDIPERGEQTDTYGSSTGNHCCAKCCTHRTQFYKMFDQIGTIAFRSLEHRDQVFNDYHGDTDTARRDTIIRITILSLFEAMIFTV
jgi:hypothetical protein